MSTTKRRKKNPESVSPSDATVTRIIDVAQGFNLHDVRPPCRLIKIREEIRADMVVIRGGQNLCNRSPLGTENRRLVSTGQSSVNP